MEVLIAARIGSGIAVGILATVILSALSSTATSENRGKVMSLFHVANNTGIAIYPLVGALIGLAIGWRATFAVTGVLAIIAAALLLPLLLRMDIPTKKKVRNDRVDPARILYGRRRIVAVASVNYGVVANMVHRHGFRNTILPLYAATVLGLGGLSIATAIAIMSVAGLMVATPGGMLGDRIGRRRVIVSGLPAVAVGDLVFILTNDLLSFLVVAAAHRLRRLLLQLADGPDVRGRSAGAAHPDPEHLPVLGGPRRPHRADPAGRRHGPQRGSGGHRRSRAPSCSALP